MKTKNQQVQVAQHISSTRHVSLGVEELVMFLAFKNGGGFQRIKTKIEEKSQGGCLSFLQPLESQRQ